MDPEDEDPTDPQRRDLMQWLYYMNKLDISLSKHELYCLQVSMRKLVKQEKLLDIR